MSKNDKSLPTTNPMAEAWLDAAKDLGIRIDHPFTFTTKGGITATTEGVYLPEFGGSNGTVLTCRFDPDGLDELADDTDYYRSWLNPHCYEPYEREHYIDTLNDWGWFGLPDDQPEWFSGKYWGHGGSIS